MIEQIETIRRKVKAANFVMSNAGYFEPRVVQQAHEVVSCNNANDYLGMNAAGFNHEVVEEDWHLETA